MHSVYSFAWTPKSYSLMRLRLYCWWSVVSSTNPDFSLIKSWAKQHLYTFVPVMCGTVSPIVNGEKHTVLYFDYIYYGFIIIIIIVAIKSTDCLNKVLEYAQTE